ncbi:MAG: DUF4397 domain-containing protein [Gemmatimonadota bacterium]
MRLHRLLAVLVGAAALSSCEKNGVQELTGAAPGARIRFFNFGLNAPQLNFYAGANKVTAVNSTSGTEATTGIAYGGVGAGGFYSSVTPGPYDLTGRIAATVDKDLVVSTLNATLVDGKAYSLYTSGLYNTTTKQVEAFIVEDDYSLTIDFTRSYVRFVNAIYNSQPMTLYVKDRVTNVETVITGTVPYKGASAFTPVPNGVYDLSVRLPGSSTSTIVRTEVSFSAGKVYTVSARGDITVTSTTATNRPFLDNTANQ